MKPIYLLHICCNSSRYALLSKTSHHLFISEDLSNIPFRKLTETKTCRTVLDLKLRFINDGTLPKFHIAISSVLAKK